MACTYFCDGCGKESSAVFSNEGWQKPPWWTTRAVRIQCELPNGGKIDLAHQLDACSENCMAQAAIKYGVPISEGRP